MTDDAAETHTYDVHMAILPGALGWASTQGPASTANHHDATYTAYDRRYLLDLHPQPANSDGGPRVGLRPGPRPGSALAAPRAVLRPPGGPPPEGVDNVAGGKAMTTTSSVYDR